MSTVEIGKSLVALCREGKFFDAIEKHYAPSIVSIEGAAMPGMDQRMEGIDAIRGKNQWWVENHEVHGLEVEGPFCCEGDDHFAVRFEIDTTFKATGERKKSAEVAYYTVEDGKIVEERFFYNVG